MEKTEFKQVQVFIANETFYDLKRLWITRGCKQSQKKLLTELVTKGINDMLIEELKEIK